MGVGNSKQQIELQNLQGRDVIVTGGNSGIGFETCRYLAYMGAAVVMASRSAERAQEAIQRIKDEFPAWRQQHPSFIPPCDDVTLEFRELQLDSLQSVADFAAQYQASGRQLHVLVCNAGLGLVEKQLTQDGLELMFQVNYLSHLLLTLLLLPLLTRRPDPRVINVSSMAQRSGKLQLDNLQGERGHSPMGHYCNSKLYQVMVTALLSRRLSDTPVSLYSLHPGAVRTNFQTHAADRCGLQCLIGCFRVTGLASTDVANGAATSVNLAARPDAGQHRGLYFENGQPTLPSRLARDAVAQERLWGYSLPLIRRYLTEESLVLLGEAPPQCTDPDTEPADSAERAEA